jgi:hypothetical protein
MHNYVGTVYILLRIDLGSQLLLHYTAEASFDDHLPEILEYLTTTYPWLKRITDKADQGKITALITSRDRSCG